MSPDSLEVRMDRLERRVESLEQLPERVTALETQIVHLRKEMRSEFSATRRELTDRMESLFETNERHMRALHEDLVQRIATINEGRP
jgi:uncharacterized alpha-E superfamily protein